MVKPMYYRFPGTNHKCSDYQGVLIFPGQFTDMIKHALFGTMHS